MVSLRLSGVQDRIHPSTNKGQGRNPSDTIERDSRQFPGQLAAKRSVLGCLIVRHSLGRSTVSLTETFGHVTTFLGPAGTVAPALVAASSYRRALRIALIGAARSNQISKARTP